MTTLTFPGFWLKHVQYQVLFGIADKKTQLRVVNEVINYYQRGRSPSFVVSLDATKAFDKLWRAGLFFKL